MVAISTCLFIYHAKIPQASTISKSSIWLFKMERYMVVIELEIEREWIGWLEWLVQSNR